MPDPVPGATRRLDRLLLGYLAGVVAVIVLSPFRLEPASFDRILLVPGGADGRTDVLLNLALFVPLGFLLERRFGVWRTAILGLGLSLGIEITQLFLPGRWTTLSDLAANGLGAWVGASGSALVRRRLAGPDGITGRLFLDLPLVALAWLLVPLIWIEGLTTTRWLPTLALAAAGGAAVAAAGRSNAERTRGRPGVLWPILGAWAFTAALPGLSSEPLRGLAAVAVAGLACLAGDSWWGRRRADRRVEPGGVLAVLLGMAPWFAVRIGDPVALAFPAPSGREVVLEWLAIAAGFTALGYAVAEWRGRSEQRWPRGALVPAMLAAAIAAVMAGARPLLVGGAAILACFGTLLFEAHRAHVVAQRRGR